MKKNNIIIPIVLLIIAFISMFVYQGAIIHKIKHQTFEILRDSAKEQKKLLVTKIDGQFDILETLANSIVSLSDKSKNSIRDIMDAVKNSSDFSYIAVSDKNGIAYESSDICIEISDRSYYQIGMMGRKAIEKISDSRFDDLENLFTLTVPIIKDNVVLGIVIGSYYENDFKKLLISNAFNQQGYSFVCDNNGQIIINSDKQDYYSLKDNIFENNENMVMHNTSITKLKKDFSDISSGIIVYSYYGEKYYGIYEPLQFNDWYIFNVIPDYVVEKRISWFVCGGVILMLIMFVSTILTTSLVILRERRSIQQIESQRVSMMLSQIKPHFLYNTLSAIRGMILVEPNKAQQLVYNFSKYMRANIDSLSHEELIPFEKELEHVKVYTEIEKVRFEGKIETQFNIDAIDFYIPPLTIQPIVENAIKHGIRGNNFCGTVYLSTFEQFGKHNIVVEDNGVGFEMESHLKNASSAGLNNVKYRLKKMCNGNIVIESCVGKGTKVTISIPKSNVKE